MAPLEKLDVCRCNMLIVYNKPSAAYVLSQHTCFESYNTMSKSLHTIAALVIFSLINFASGAYAASCRVVGVTDAISDFYEGPCVDGLAHGKGKARGREKYEGGFSKGKLHGQGKYDWGIGHSYSGSFANGIRTGLGTYMFPNGNVYRGHFLDDKLHGKGKMTYANGGFYDGVYVNNKKTGLGKNLYTNSDTYVGEHFNNDSHGKGTWKRGPKNRCPKLGAGDFCHVEQTGTFKDGRFVNGKMTFADGDSHVGRVTYDEKGTPQIHNKTAFGRNDGDPIKLLGAIVGTAGRVVGSAVGNGGSTSGSSSSGGKHSCSASSGDYINGNNNPKGYSKNFDTEAQARERALLECRKEGGKRCSVYYCTTN